jgi:hypothetical protein
MPIRPRLVSWSFSPKDIAAITSEFDDALRSLGLFDCEDAAVTSPGAERPPSIAPAFRLREFPFPIGQAQDNQQRPAKSHGGVRSE